MTKWQYVQYFVYEGVVSWLYLCAEVNIWFAKKILNPFVLISLSLGYVETEVGSTYWLQLNMLQSFIGYLY